MATLTGRRKLGSGGGESAASAASSLRCPRRRQGWTSWRSSYQPSAARSSAAIKVAIATAPRRQHIAAPCARSSPPIVARCGVEYWGTVGVRRETLDHLRAPPFTCACGVAARLEGGRLNDRFSQHSMVQRKKTDKSRPARRHAICVASSGASASLIIGPGYVGRQIQWT